MGEAKRKKKSGEMEFWYHGTDEFFTNWAKPPVVSKYKPELISHQFISLSKDRDLAAGAGEVTKGLCRAKLSPSAKVLDLRVKSADAEAHWKQVVQSDVGRIHALIQTFDSFVNACESGEVLRLRTADQKTLAKLGPLQAIAQSRSVHPVEREKAHLEVQNFTRQWIDDAISPARNLGYQAVICAEIDRYRAQGPRACLNLYVFDPLALSPPEWLTVPDEKLMLPYMAEHINNRFKN